MAGDGSVRHGIKITTNAKVGESWYVPSLGVRVTLEQAAAGLESLGYAAFDYAYSMAGNPGQQSIIEGMGVEAFVDAAHVYVNNGYDAELTAEFLRLDASYGEAVSEIMDNIGTFFDENVNGANN